MTFTTELTGAPKVTGPDSRVMRTQGQPTIQGYNAQAAVTGDQIGRRRWQSPPSSRAAAPSHVP